MRLIDQHFLHEERSQFSKLNIKFSNSILGVLSKHPRLTDMNIHVHERNLKQVYRYDKRNNPLIPK